MCLEMISKGADVEALLKIYRGMTLLAIKSVVFIPKMLDHLLEMTTSEKTQAALNLGIAENLIIVAKRNPDSFQAEHISFLFTLINGGLAFVESRARLCQAIIAIFENKIIFDIICKEKAVITGIEAFISQTLMSALNVNLKHSLSVAKLAGLLCYYLQEDIQHGSDFVDYIDAAAKYVLSKTKEAYSNKKVCRYY
jgi:hypothetical protein